MWEVIVSEVIFSGSGYALALAVGALEADVRDEGGWSSVEALLKLDSSVSSAFVCFSSPVLADDGCSSATLLKCRTLIFRAMCVSEKGRLMPGRKGFEYSRTVSRTAYVISLRDV